MKARDLIEDQLKGKGYYVSRGKKIFEKKNYKKRQNGFLINLHNIGLEGENWCSPHTHISRIS